MSSYNVVQCRRILREDEKPCIIAIVKRDDNQMLLVRQTPGDDGQYSWTQVVMYRIGTSDVLESLLPDIGRFFREDDVEHRVIMSSIRLRADLIAASKSLH